MSKDLIYKHFDLFNLVMDANDSSKDVIWCPNCDFRLTYKNHTLSFESVLNKTIQHILDTHKGENNEN